MFVGAVTGARSSRVLATEHESRNKEYGSAMVIRYSDKAELRDPDIECLRNDAKHWPGDILYRMRILVGLLEKRPLESLLLL